MIVGIHSKASLGIIYMLISAGFFSLMNAFVKLSSGDFSATELIFFRSFIMVLFLGAFLLNSPPKKSKKSGGYVLLIFRSLVGGLSMLALFYNIATISLGSATAFAQSTPIYVGIFSAIFLKERLGTFGFIAIIIGFAGVLLVSKPPFFSGEPLPLESVILGIFSGVGAALAFMSVRGLKDYFDGNVIILSFGATMSVASLIILLWNPSFFPSDFVMPQNEQWLFVIALGVFGTLGQYFMTKAYMSAPAGIVAPIDYTRIIFSLFLGIMLGDALPDLLSVSGITLIILSGIFIALPIFLRDYRRMKNHTKLRHHT